MLSTGIHEQCWDGSTDLENVKRCVNNGHFVLVLMRGVPGSGKSYLAKELVEGTNGVILSTDDHFIVNGEYKFDGTKLQEYHKRNLNDAKSAMAIGVKPVIIDNTNIYSAHMRPYILQAVKFRYEIYFLEPLTEWKKKPAECAKRNIHNIDEQKIAYLTETFEYANLEYLIRPTKLRIVPPPLDDGYGSSAFYRYPQNNPLMLRGSLWMQNAVEFAAGRSDFCMPIVAPSSAKELARNFGNLLVAKPNEDVSVNVKSDRETEGEATSMTNSVSETQTFASVDAGVSASDKQKRLFSLLPKPQYMHHCYLSLGVQTSDVIQALVVGNKIPEECAEQLVTKAEVLVVRKAVYGAEVNFVMKDRATQTDATFELSDVDLLMTMFPEEAAGDLLHVLQMVGLQHAIQIFIEMGARLEVFAQVEPQQCLEFESPLLSETMETENPFERNAIPLTPSPSALLPSEDSASREAKLQPSSAKQRREAEPVQEGFYRMNLSLDMIRKLSDLFGNGEETDISRSYVDLPLWRWRQIFQSWQGLPVTGPYEGEGFSCEDFESAFPSVERSNSATEDPVEKDEVLAKALQSEEYSSSNNNEMFKRKMDTAARLQLNQLFDEFSGIDRNCIEECFRDVNYSANAARETLKIFEDPDGNHSVATSDNAAPPPRDTRGTTTAEKGFIRYKSADGIKVTCPDMSSVQQEVLTLQEEIDHCYRRRNELFARASNAKEMMAKQFYIKEAQQFDKRARDITAEKNEVITKANTSPTFVDLHYMDVASARKLLKEKLNAIDRPPNLRNGRSGRKIVVVTGYGKWSDGRVKLKPALIQWLSQSGYEFHMSPNPGEIIVEAK